jgi:hypothetical protein
VFSKPAIGNPDYKSNSTYRVSLAKRSKISSARRNISYGVYLKASMFSNTVLPASADLLSRPHQNDKNAERKTASPCTVMMVVRPGT